MCRGCGDWANKVCLKIRLCSRTRHDNCLISLFIVDLCKFKYLTRRQKKREEKEKFQKKSLNLKTEALWTPTREHQAGMSVEKKSAIGGSRSAHLDWKEALQSYLSRSLASHEGRPEKAPNNSQIFSFFFSRSRYITQASRYLLREQHFSASPTSDSNKR